MDYTDKTLICADCGAEFIHSAEDQERYAQRGLEHDPKRCRPCREKRKKTMPSGGGGARRGGPRQGGGDGGQGGSRRPPAELFDAVCSACGQPTQVPFKPAEGRPVYCRDCYRSQKPSGPRRGGSSWE